MHRASPVQVVGLDDVVAVSTSHNALGGYTMAIRSDGTVWGWGDNGHGQLGNGTLERQYTPAQVLAQDGGNFLNLGAAR